MKEAVSICLGAMTQSHPRDSQRHCCLSPGAPGRPGAERAGTKHR